MPAREKKSERLAPRGADTCSSSRCAGRAAPASGVDSSRIVSNPLRTTIRSRSTRMRVSSAPTVSAAGEPPGPAMSPNADAFAPSLPDGATTSVSRTVAAATACASGESSKPANGSASASSAIRAASCASPSPFGSTARSSPATIWSPRA